MFALAQLVILPPASPFLYHYHHISITLGTIIMPRPAPALQVFPLSNVRDCPEENPPSPPPACNKPGSHAIRISKLSEPFDHLSVLPKKKHRYLGPTGRVLFDDSYSFPKPVKVRAETRSRKRRRTGPNAIASSEINTVTRSDSSSVVGSEPSVAPSSEPGPEHSPQVQS